MSTVAERSPCLIVKAVQDPGDRDYVTLECLCGESLRVLRAEGYERWDEHADSRTPVPTRGDTICSNNQSGGRAALTAGPLDDDLHGGVASA